MKKKSGVLISVVIIIALLIFNFFTVTLLENRTVTARYIYGDKNITTELSQEDAKRVIEILNSERFDLYSAALNVVW